MKSLFSQLSRSLAVLSLALSMGAVASSAATNPLSFPRGLAVDAKGNLWVANSGDNNVIAFTPGYARIAADTITQGISNPTGVAFDPNGNLWVANYGAGGSITEYSPTLVQNTANTITNNILGPEAIAIDGLGDIWVENDYINVTLYTNNYGTPGQYVRTYNPPGLTSIYGLAVQGPWIAFGSPQGFEFQPIADYFISGAGPGADSNFQPYAVAMDAQDNVYLGGLNNVVSVGNIASYQFKTFATLSFSPAGIAVDNARGRVYMSNQNGNEILVLSTTGALLHTIK
jgi:DNA-binding beta-propeller fold protein YncE